MNVYGFLEDVDIDNILVSYKIFSGEKNCKYFIGCLCNDYKVKPLHIMYQNQTRIEKVVIAKRNGCIF